MNNIQINGKDFWVEEDGAGEPLILLVGGPAASHLIFKSYFSAFAAKYRVIYYDYFGRGRSGRPGAQAYALKYGEHLGRLILANTLHSPEMWQKNHENINREISNQFPEVWDRIMELRKQGFRSYSIELRQLFASVSANLLVRFYNQENAAQLLDGKWAPGGPL